MFLIIMQIHTKLHQFHFHALKGLIAFKRDLMWILPPTTRGKGFTAKIKMHLKPKYSVQLI